jgi:hypothetical protein
MLAREGGGTCVCEGREEGDDGKRAVSRGAFARILLAVVPAPSPAPPPQHDTDAFNRWNAGWGLARDVATGLVAPALTAHAGVPTPAAAAALLASAGDSERVQHLSDALAGVVADGDAALAAHVLSFPPTDMLVAAVARAGGAAHPRVRRGHRGHVTDGLDWPGD